MAPRHQPSRLDANQVLQEAFNDETQRLRVDSEATVVDAEIDITLTAEDDTVSIGDASTGYKLKINPNGSINVSAQAGAATEAKQDVSNVYLGNVNQGIATTNQSLSSANQELGNVNQNLGTVNNNLETVNETIGTVNNNLETVNQTIGTMFNPFAPPKDCDSISVDDTELDIDIVYYRKNGLNGILLKTVKITYKDATKKDIKFLELL
jgi:hypothetical protein